MRSEAKLKRGSNKPALGAEISARLKRNDGQIKISAEKLGLNYKGLRQDLHLNRFFEGDIQKLCGAVGLPTNLEELRACYEFSCRAAPRGLRKLRHKANFAATMPNTDTKVALQIPAVFSYIELRQEQMAQIARSANEDIESLLFRGLGKGDSLFLTITDSVPLHWVGQTSTVCLPLVAKALIEGLHICYLHPSATLSPLLQRVRGAAFLTPERVRDEFDYFRRLLDNYCDPGIVRQQTVCVEIDAPVFCVPEHRYALYHHLPKPTVSPPMCWATVTVPLLVGQANGEKIARPTIVELSRSFRDFLLELCRKTVSTILNADDDTNQSARPALEELKKRLFVPTAA